MRLIDHFLNRYVYDEKSWNGFEGFIKFILLIFLFPIYAPIIIISQILFVVWYLITSFLKEK